MMDQSGLTREFKIYPREEGNGARFVWLVRGPDLVVQFMLRFSNRTEHTERFGSLPYIEASPWDLGFHCSFDPGWAMKMDDCDLLPGGKCWYDGSGLNAERVFKIACTKGEDALWAELEDYYDDLWQDFSEQRLAGSK